MTESEVIALDAQASDGKYSVGFQKWIMETFSRGMAAGNFFCSERRNGKNFQICFQKDSKVSPAPHAISLKEKNLEMIGRLLIRKLITEVLNVPYQDIDLARTERGKPYLVNLPKEFADFNFNVSHQGDFVVLAAEPDRQVGVDVMKTELSSYQTVPEFFRLMVRQFTPQEWKAMKSHSTEDKQLECFHRFWCLKESYVKACGSGITLNLQRFDFHLSTPLLTNQVVTTDTQLYVDGKLTSWSFEESKQDEKHQIAVALAPIDDPNKHEGSLEKRLPKNFHELSFSDIVSSSVPLRRASEEDWTNFSAKNESNTQR